MTFTVSRYCAVLAFGVSCFASAKPALAKDSTDADKARELFREGRALAGNGKFDEACPKFEESLKLDDGIGTAWRMQRTKKVKPIANKHEVTATAPHKKSWSLRVETGATSTLFTITVPKLDDEPKPAAPPPPAAEKELEKKEPPPAPSRHEAEPSTVNQTVKIFLLSGAGAGVVLAATGFAIYKLSNDNAKDVCPASVGCTDDDIRRHQEFVDDASKARTVGYLGLGIAGAALVGFAAVSFSSPSNRDTAHAAFTAAPLVGSGAWGASFRGKF